MTSHMVCYTTWEAIVENCLENVGGTFKKCLAGDWMNQQTPAKAS